MVSKIQTNLYSCGNCIHFDKKPIKLKGKFILCEKDLNKKEGSTPCAHMVLRDIYLTTNINSLIPSLDKLSVDELCTFKVLMKDKIKVRDIIDKTGFDIGSIVIYVTNDIIYQCTIVAIKADGTFILKTLDKNPLTFITTVGSIKHKPVFIDTLRENVLSKSA